MLHNVNLNTLTIYLSICNMMASPTQYPLYLILEVEYDDQHRAHILSDNDVEVALPPLRPRTYTRAHQWNEHYAPYIRRAGFLELVPVVNYGLPPLDPALLITTVDRFECLLWPRSAYPKTALFSLFFQSEQCFSLTRIQPEQCFQPVSAIIQQAERGLCT